MSDKRFFIQIPNLIDDADLTPYEHRLYFHLVRVCGTTGVCSQGTRLLAEWCGFSAGNISKAKEGLKRKGLIKIRKVQTPNGEGDEIKLTDIWSLNAQLYDKNLQIDSPKNPNPLQRMALKAAERFSELKNKNRNTKLPEEFKLDKELRVWAEENCSGVDVEEEFENFINFNSSNKSRNWKSYFRKWLKDAVKYKT